jgi:hypothetical protein
VCVSLVRSEILDPWPMSPGFGSLPGLFPKKIRFSERNLSSCYLDWTSSKGLSTRNVFCIGPMIICACGLLHNPSEAPNFQYRAWLCSMDQKFHGDDENTQELRFWDLVQWPTAIIRQKSRNSNIRHDGILPIENFMLMIILQFFSCLVTC